MVRHRDVGPTGHVRGESHGRRKLTWEQVEYIRGQYSAKNKTQRELAEEFGVTQTTIYRVVRNHNWKPG